MGGSPTDACFLAGLKKADLPGEPHRPRQIIYVSYFRNREYSFLVDVTEEFEQKIKAVAAYTSQFADAGQSGNGPRLEELVKNGQRNIFHPGVNIYDLMHTRARELGQMVNVGYAEAYSIKEHILIDDPQRMPVRSI